MTTSSPSKGSIMFLEMKTSIKIWTILILYVMLNDFRGTELEYTLACDAWRPLVIQEL